MLESVFCFCVLLHIVAALIGESLFKKLNASFPLLKHRINAFGYFDLSVLATIFSVATSSSAITIILLAWVIALSISVSREFRLDAMILFRITFLVYV